MPVPAAFGATFPSVAPQSGAPYRSRHGLRGTTRRELEQWLALAATVLLTAAVFALPATAGVDRAERPAAVIGAPVSWE